MYTFILAEEKPRFSHCSLEKSASETSWIERFLLTIRSLFASQPTILIIVPAEQFQSRRVEKAATVGCYHATLPENKGRAAVCWEKDEYEGQVARIQYLQGVRILEPHSQIRGWRQTRSRPLLDPRLSRTSRVQWCCTKSNLVPLLPIQPHFTEPFFISSRTVNRINVARFFRSRLFAVAYSNVVFIPEKRN